MGGEIEWDLPLKWREKSRLKFVLRKTERERDRESNSPGTSDEEKELGERYHGEDKQESVEDIKENNIRSDIIWH